MRRGFLVPGLEQRPAQDRGSLVRQASRGPLVVGGIHGDATSVCRTALADEENRRVSPRNAQKITAETSGPTPKQLLLQGLAAGLAAEERRDLRVHGREARPPGPAILRSAKPGTACAPAG